jgi:hypothetical protein
MKLSQLAAKPQLIKIQLDDEEVVKEYGEPLEFWIHDRQPIEKYIELATTASDNYGEMIRVVNNLVLDEDGTVIAQDGMVFPSKLMIKIINKVVEKLGN